jgi:4-amino-4-deoxy-L-arabinose transferase-like glycosyltransferase
MSGTRKRDLLQPAILLGAPLILRLITLLQLHGNPLFRLPLVDARVYHEMAARLAAGLFVRHEPFWQPPLYPYFLGLLYKIGSPNPDVARAVQILLGSISCLLVFRLGQRMFNRRAAWVAWGIMTAYGPLILSDLQLLNSTLAIVLLLLALDLITGAAATRDGKGTSWRLPAAGLTLGLASITVATLVVAIPVVALWLILRPPERSRRLRAGILVSAALGPILVVMISNWAVSRELVPISYNGGLNFYLGNNPDYTRTVGLRPGRAWLALNDEPRRAGVTGYAASSSWWVRRTLAWGRRDPAAWTRLLLYKTRLLLRGDEIGRNSEIYPFRNDSWLLGLLLWIGGLAFPFGVLLPLAAAGMITLLWRGQTSGADEHSPHEGAGLRRYLPRWPAAFAAEGGSAFTLSAVLAGALSLSVIAFFVTERYRLPLVPLLALSAGGGAAGWMEEWKRGQRRCLLVPALTVLAFGLIANTGLPAMPARFGSDSHYDLGLYYSEQGRKSEAADQYRLALQRDPDNMEAADNLGGILLQQGDPDGAAHLFNRILSAYPRDPEALLNLGSVYYHKGEPYKAGNFYLQVYKIDPRAPHAEENLRGLEQVLSRLESEQMGKDSAIFLDSLDRLSRADPGNEFLRLRLRRILAARTPPG